MADTVVAGDCWLALPEIVTNSGLTRDRFLTLAVPLGEEILRDGFGQRGYSEGQTDFRSSTRMDVDFCAQLPRQHVHQAKAERSGCVRNERRIQANPVIGEAQRDGAGRRLSQDDAHLSRSTVRESVFERVGESFIEDQAAGKRCIEIEEETIQVEVKPDAFAIDAVGREKVCGQFTDV